MSRSKLLATACAAAMFAGVAGPAAAADPKMPYKWYLSGFGGWTVTPDFDFSFTGGGCAAVKCNYSHSLDDGYVVGGAIGVIVNSNTRVELELSKSHAKVGNDYVGTNFGFVGAGERGHQDITTGFVNAWFNTQWGFVSPYIGGGIGFGVVDAKLSTTNGAGLQYSGRDVGMAGQLGAGLRMPVGSNFELDLGYRVRGVLDITVNPGAGINATAINSENFITHSFQAGLTVKF
jgi:opacity protein-like surface antigen